MQLCGRLHFICISGSDINALKGVPLRVAYLISFLPAAHVGENMHTSGQQKENSLLIMGDLPPPLFFP